ncbi:RNA polymerase sigma factor [Pontibacter cellulosilyticus]|uniref:Sigma-70 family RNA polymerase sigma factor n=1 Tax=Pontibacter cellulosilyticus TaxID=1720253 RepID=A0A923N4F7_9BACT|nr:sigma-70 family RNA polymerase sigma factor [Pontibacter cellulosilyticus]MBC5991542.1 sigma-70 family RNA polymerase sigma factor [Pontibacter cellulosilyticus]
MKDAFLELISQHQGIIHKICRLYRDTPEDRQDLFQEVVYQLWKSYPKFRQEASISTWMYRIALNTALASLRKPTLKINYTDTLPDILSESSTYADDQQEQLFKALKQLNDGEKALVTLFLEEMSYKEMADVLGISEGNVGVRLNRIKNKLMNLIITHSHGS